MLFDVVLAIVAIVAGGIAAVTGFGIGSLLTPTLALETVRAAHARSTTSYSWSCRW